MYNKCVNPEVAIAQLSIVDGAWQESPDNLAILDQGVRGTMFLLTEVTGDVEGRDALAREVLETVRREFSGSRGAITLALTQAIRETNNFFYNVNLNTSPQARRIAGLTAVVLRENDLYIAQGGPGLTCVARRGGMERYPEQSAWFDPSEEIGDFTMPGEVPLGLRKEYMPDLFHVTLQPGDTILLSTRSLAHLLTNEELLDTITGRHPDEIIETLEDIAGAADLSAIAIQLEGEPVEPVAEPRLALPGKRVAEAGAAAALDPHAQTALGHPLLCHQHANPLRRRLGDLNGHGPNPPLDDLPI